VQQRLGRPVLPGPLVATFLTKMDASVRQSAGMAAEACGREPAGANEKAAFAFLRTLYKLERFNGIARSVNQSVGSK
jgi:hypothetical protein